MLFFSTPTRLSPRSIMIIELSIPRILEKVKLTPSLFPRRPRSPPRSVNPISRPVWKKKIAFLFF